MKSGNVSTGAGKLNLAFKTLRAQWHEARPLWSDIVAQAYEENHLAVLEQHVNATLREVNRLGLTLARAHQECSFE